MLFAENYGKQFLACGIFSDYGNPGGKFFAAHDLSGFQLLEFEKILDYFRLVGRIILHRLDNPAVFAGGKNRLGLVADFQFRDSVDADVADNAFAGYGCRIRLRRLSRDAGGYRGGRRHDERRCDFPSALRHCHASFWTLTIVLFRTKLQAEALERCSTTSTSYRAIQCRW